ncbi:MAG: hypothetical protein RI990_623 [Planctomycetota bacterium]
MSIFNCTRGMVVAGLVGTVVLASDAAAEVKSFTQLNWTEASGSDGLYISLNNVTSPVFTPSASNTEVAGWDIKIKRSNGGASLEFEFPPQFGPVNPNDPNPWYGIMRMPGVTTGPGANLPMEALIQSTASFAADGPVVFGSAAGQWKLNSVNYMGFRFKHRVLATDSIHYGWMRIVVGATPGSFLITDLGLEATAGAALFVGEGLIPAPGVLPLLAAAGVASRRRRR